MTLPRAGVDLVGDSLPMRRLRELIATIAPTSVPVLVEGETGTGKELIAALVHAWSRRPGKLVAFNVCALGESMFEDTLFGHVRGAFTGAVGDAAGLLREADGGTAFFDEISGLPMPLQAKLLRAVETGVFRPIGARADVHSSFRLVAATNERLDTLVRVGRFRADLTHRISGVTVRVPSLAERVEDIPELARHFARRAAGRDVSIDPRAIALLEERSWPGNVRELKQVVDVAVAFARDALTRDAVNAALANRTVDVPAPTDDRLERRELVEALSDAAGNIERAAAQLGVHRATMYRRMKRHGISTQPVAPSRATSQLGVATGATSGMQ